MLLSRTHVCGHDDVVACVHIRAAVVGSTAHARLSGSSRVSMHKQACKHCGVLPCTCAVHCSIHSCILQVALIDEIY
jgi:hypothetical protein